MPTHVSHESADAAKGPKSRQEACERGKEARRPQHSIVQRMRLEKCSA